MPQVFVVTDNENFIEWFGTKGAAMDKARQHYPTTPRTTITSVKAFTYEKATSEAVAKMLNDITVDVGGQEVHVYNGLGKDKVND